ncbi:YibE/F family protein [Nonomuraea cypriaca]|uniref:YibE/F family protein n=1 Tax=Nonomuraea cypriaca TaxID=1187855 RepID=UPI001A9C4B0A|nr:YibE/F family protein [Nonomuraea cypriaca]
MGANHAHGTTPPASRRTVVAGLAVLVPLALVTLASLLWLWPEGRQDTGQAAPQSTVERLTGTVTGVTLKRCPATAEGSPQPDPATCGTATVRVGEGPDVGKDVTLRLPGAPGSQRFAVDDDVVLLRDAEGAYQISDHDRAVPLWLFGAAFALAVIAFGRWRGVRALAGLAITFVFLLTFVIPGILEGRPPMLVAIVGSAAIMLIVLYLTHGFSLPTSMAVLGTLGSLALTGLLSYFALGFAQLNGITDDVGLTLGMSLPIDTQGLLLAGIIIGALGVLDDVTVTQAVTVAELARANPSYGFARLYRAAGRIGRAHIASVINTIILAYAGASLPLLLLFSIGAQPLGEVLTTPVIAQEIVRSVVGTLGLIAAVPITTALAALTASHHREPPTEPTRPGTGHDGHHTAGPPTRHDGFFTPQPNFPPQPDRDDFFAPQPDRDDFFAPQPDRDDFFAPQPDRDDFFAPQPDQDGFFAPQGDRDGFSGPRPRREEAAPPPEPTAERPPRHRRRRANT